MTGVQTCALPIFVPVRWARLAAALAGVLVGAMGIERYGAYGLLRSAVTAPSWRGRGVGQALTHERIDWARSQRLTALFLLTTTAADFFARFGFQPVERPTVPEEIRRSREFSSACPASATVMVLSLDDPAR